MTRLAWISWRGADDGGDDVKVQQKDMPDHELDDKGHFCMSPATTSLMKRHARYLVKHLPVLIHAQHYKVIETTFLHT